MSVSTIQNYLMFVPTSLSASVSAFSNFVLSIFGWTGVCVQTEYFVYQSLYRQYLDVIQIEIRQTIFEEISDRRAAFFLKSRQNPDSWHNRDRQKLNWQTPDRNSGSKSSKQDSHDETKMQMPIKKTKSIIDKQKMLNYSFRTTYILTLIVGASNRWLYLMWFWY